MWTFVFRKMKILVVCVFLVLALWTDPSYSKHSAPKVQIYSRAPGHFGEPNILICHASSFHPPELDLELLLDGKKMENTTQTDLAFEENWYYHLTQHANFTPVKGHQYSCRVTHLGEVKSFIWEPDV